MDYDKWADEPGMEHWGYEHCLPYFKRMENRLVGGDEWRGDEGPLKLETGPAKNPLFNAWLEAGPQAGFHSTPDVNGFNKKVSPSSTRTWCGVVDSAPPVPIYIRCSPSEPHAAHACSGQQDRFRRHACRWC